MVVCATVETGLPSEDAPLSLRPNRFQAGTAAMMGGVRGGKR